MSGTTIDDDPINDDNEWTDMCRVCLGPDEEGFPLYRPCICAGSIACVHQKCLEATIAEKRVSKCPVCHYKYQFRPQYAPNAPSKLSTMEVVSGLVLRATHKWVPLALRLLLVLFIWVGVLPLLTSYMYQGWLHGPSSMITRLTKNITNSNTNTSTTMDTKTNMSTNMNIYHPLYNTNTTNNDDIDSKNENHKEFTLEYIFGDIISGLIITSAIVISFLSLMSLTEHFRFNWQPQRQRQILEEEERLDRLRQEELEAARERLLEQQHPQRVLERLRRQKMEQQLQLLEEPLQRQQQLQDDMNIGEEYYNLLRQGDIEFHEKAENGFATSEDDEDNDSNLFHRSSNEEEEKLHQQEVDGDGNVVNDNGNANGTDDSNDHANGDNEPENRNPIGIMDEGQTIFSDEMDINELFKQQKQDHFDNNHDVEDDDSIHDDFMINPNESFYSLSDVLLCYDGTDNGIGNGTNNGNGTLNNTNGHHQNERRPSLEMRVGTPIRRHRQRGTLQRQILNHMDPDVNDDDDDDDDNENADGIADLPLLSHHRRQRQIFDPLDPDANDDYDNAHGIDDLPFSSHHRNINDTNGHDNSNDDRGDDHSDDHNNDNHDYHYKHGDDDIHHYDHSDHGDDNDGDIGHFHPRRQHHQLSPIQPRHIVQEDDADVFERMMRLQEEAEEEDDLYDPHQHDNNAEEDGPDPFEPQFEPLEPALNNPDQMDMDMAMPLDELIGLRGPVSSLIKNLCWFLAFNTSYLAVFASVPAFIGSITYVQYSQTYFISKFVLFFFDMILLLPFTKLTRESDETATIAKIMALLDKETEERNCILRPSDMAKIALGYLTLAGSVFIMQGLARLYNRTKAKQQLPNNMMPGDANTLMTEKISDLIECISAVAKVGVLIFLKMMLLPFILGLWLDISTLELYQSCLSDRVKLAGEDIIGFFLLHWVVGITFMLIVTVSVLQFREVLHPDILAHIIRPQESQPDMIANLLQDDGWTHIKRIVPSLGIYAGLLFLHVWVPGMLLSRWGLDTYMPLFRPKTWYIVSKQLQIPIELIVFHISMLSMLERYKNRIGETQHICLLKVCNILNMADNLLPRAIGKFKLRTIVPLRSGSRRLNSMERMSKPTSNPTSIDPFWEKLLNLHENGGATNDCIELYLDSSPSCIEKFWSPTTEDGEPQDPFHSHIALPIFEKKTTKNQPFAKKLLPPRIGRYRFRKQQGTSNEDIRMEIWQEVMGTPVARPPKGWDYLGDNGGAVEQGRWAWGKEVRSDIETSLAVRKPFFPSIIQDNKVVQKWRSRKFWVSLLSVILKVVLLLLFSWTSVSCCIYGAISIPLAIGRALYHLLGISSEYTHDPVLFMIGSAIFFPFLVKITDFFCTKAANSEGSNKLPKVRFLMTAPRGKALILIQAAFLWLVLSPLILGLSYELFFLNMGSFWSLEVSNARFHHIIYTWAVGFVLLHVWIVFCYFGGFDRGFWARIGRFAFNEMNEGRNGVAPPHEDNDENNWQGEKGKLHCFIHTLKQVMVEQEWEKLDRAAILDDTAFPITKKLFMLLVGPVAISFGCYEILKVFNSTVVDSEYCAGTISRVFLYRWFTAVSCIVMLLMAFKSRIRSWFKAAHQAARDQRYLLGQELLDRKS